MLIFYDCGKKNCPDARGFRCFFGKDIYDGISNRRHQEEALFGLCDGVVERIKSLPRRQCELSNDFFIHYMATFPQQHCKVDTDVCLSHTGAPSP